jgi:VWFA-related protein
VKRITTASLVAAAPFAVALSMAQDDAGIPQEPLEVGVTEQVRVGLVLLETLVLDGRGRTVPGLTRDDFILKVNGNRVPIDVLDVDCPAGAVDDVRDADWARGEGRPSAVMPELGRRIVLAFDYYHLNMTRRADVLGQAQAMIAHDKAPGDEVMIVALANGLRIEQRFTADAETLVEALRRMEYDSTLYAMDFGSLVDDRSLFDNLATLADVLANYDGTKAVILFSQLVSRAYPSRPRGRTISLPSVWDLWFENVAARAAAARTVIYPVDASGLNNGGPVGGSPSLARLATQSGGRFTYLTNDLSLGYARAQRDLACRYTVGFYVEAGEMRDRRAIKVKVKRGLDFRVYSPEIVRYGSAEERRRARLEAAFSDPEPLDEPLIRTQAFALRPRSASAWDGLWVVHFPWPVPADGATLGVAAKLMRGHLSAGESEQEFRVEPAAPGGTGTRPVTVVGEARLKPGSHTLTVVVARAGGERLHTSRVEFAVPEVPRGEIFLRGPVLAKAVRDGVLIRVADHGERKAWAPEQASMRGEDETVEVEPVVVHDFDPSDTILARWDACYVGRSDTDANSSHSVVRRVIRESDDTVVHQLTAIPLDLKSEDKDKGAVSCQSRVDDVPPGTLEPGSYHLEITVLVNGSDVPLAAARAPIRVD